jgi:hypothetical protein
MAETRLAPAPPSPGSFHHAVSEVVAALEPVARYGPRALHDVLQEAALHYGIPIVYEEAPSR